MLLLPLVIAVLNVADDRVFPYVYLSGRKMPGEARTLWTSEGGWQRSAPLLRPSELFGPVDAVFAFSSPVTTPSLTGVTRMAYLRAYEDREVAPRGLWLPLVVSVVLLLPLPTFVIAGYYRVVLEVVSASAARWELFLARVRRYFVRLLGYWALVVVLHAPGTVFYILASGRSFTSEWPFRLLDWWTWGALPLAWFSLALTATVLVNDDVGVFRAIRRGVVTVYRRLLTALVLLVMIGAVEFVVQWPVRGIAYLLEGRLLGLDSVRALLVGMPLGMLLEATYAAVGVWFCVAAFLWYRDASARLWPRAEEEQAAVGEEVAVGGCG